MEKTVMNRKTVTAYVLVILAAVGFGLQPLLANIVYGYGIGPVMLAWLRVACMCPIFLILSLLKRQKLAVGLRPVLKCAFLGLMGAVLTTAFLFNAYRMIDTSVATILNFTYPVFVLVLGIVIYREKADIKQVLALIICIAGIILVCGKGGNISFAGAALALGSGITYGIYILYLDKSRIIDEIGFFSFSFWFFLMSAVMLLPIAAFGGEFSLRISAEGWLWVIIFSLDGGIIATTFLSYGINIVGGVRSAIIGALEPVTSVIAGVLAFDEVLTGLKILGIVLIIAATVVVILPGKEKAAR